MPVDTRMSKQVESASKLLNAFGAIEGPVAIVGQPGPTSSAACIACLNSAIAYLPIDSGYPVERIRYIIEDSGASVLLVDSSLEEQKRKSLASSVSLIPQEIDVSEERSGANQANLERTKSNALSNLRDGDNRVAYLIYTSGSTGRPKGISVSRSNLANQLSWLVKEGHLGSHVKILQKTPIGFDAAQWEILAPLTGASVGFIDAGEYRDPNALLEAVRDQGITHLQAVPTLIQAICDLEGLEDLPTLTHIFSGGEALTWNLVRRIRQRRPDVTIVNLYGPSECTINSSAFVIEPQHDIDVQTLDIVPLGTPVSNTSFKIDAPEGQSGELLIGGAQVALGYVGKPEETMAKFFDIEGEPFYRTGDVVRKNDRGDYIFLGRIDDQVKVRGNRVELGELSSRFEAHPWVSRAHCLVVPKSHGSGSNELVACIQLDNDAAPLMDGKGADSHHRSKSNKHQVKAQVSNPGLRKGLNPSLARLPASYSLSDCLDELTFQRKSYRNFQSHEANHSDLTMLWRTLRGLDLSYPLRCANSNVSPNDALQTALGALTGRMNSERLLPKYAYASPGSLYSLQAYLELGSDDFLKKGIYYFHPLNQTFHYIAESSGSEGSCIHLISKTRAISDVYKKNVEEVQYLELGHYLGLLDDVSRATGCDIKFDLHHGIDNGYDYLLENAEDLYLGAMRLGKDNFYEPRTFRTPSMFVSVLAAGDELEKGTYVFSEDGKPHMTSSDVVDRNHVIAINQPIYDGAVYGVGMYFDDETAPIEMRYVSLGAAMHRLQTHSGQIGLVPSGYSSFSGDPLPASDRAKQLVQSVGEPNEFACYFALAGRVTTGQKAHRGMAEDIIHMSGPAEIITKEMSKYVPEYMVPDRTVVLGEVPTTPNGKVDVKRLKALKEVQAKPATGVGRPPSEGIETVIAEIWQEVLKVRSISAEDSFFDLGGDSIRVMMTLRKLQTEFGHNLTPQLLFEFPVLEEFSNAIAKGESGSRLIKLAENDSALPRKVIMWPGLGGVPLRLRSLAGGLEGCSEVLAFQASGLNVDEPIFSDVQSMANHDVEYLNLENEYHLVGYSFGCRVAYAAAAALETAGAHVGSLTLLCPGNPTLSLQGEIEQSGVRESNVSNPEFLGMLLSVFDSQLDMTFFRYARERVRSLDDAVCLIAEQYSEFDIEQVRRIVNLVAKTYEFDYRFDELGEMAVECPILLVKAQGDQYSSVDEMLNVTSSNVRTVAYPADHYQILRNPHARKLSALITEFQKSPYEQIGVLRAAY